MNNIVVQSFGKDIFAKAVMEASGSLALKTTKQVEYVSRYCEMLGAKTFVVEDYYVDRHYIEEYALYYSRTLQHPPNYVRRFHVFDTTFSNPELSKMFESGMTSRENRKVIEDKLSISYLGFISIRPLPSVPVGRTVLRRLPDEPAAHRDIWATTTYEAHLANLKLRVEGLAFQQQDVAVGACATAALWTALSRVARHEGMRAPTPAEVSEAAVRHLLPNGRSIPAAGGLTMQQLCEAIRCCGFAPEAIKATTMPEYFMIALHTYLLSGIPVVLALRRKGSGHAVTAAGFQIDKKPNPLLQATVRVRSARVNKLYVHDDRLGPYARSFVSPLLLPPKSGEGLCFEIEKEQWLIDSALAPVYPKLRLSVRSLINLAETTGAILEKIVGAKNATRLNVEFYYKRSGDYLSDLGGRGISNGSDSFLRTVAFSRWCAVVRWYLDEDILAEFVYDTTDILRERGTIGRNLLRAIICFIPGYTASINLLGQIYKVPNVAA